MMDHEKVNILLVDDQPAKLLAYEVILKELGENLVVAASGRGALEILLKNEIAIILVESEQRRSMAIAAGKMGSWDWDWINGDWMWDEGQYRIFGVNPNSFEVTSANIQALLHPDDLDELRKAIAEFSKGARSYEAEF